MAPHREMNRMLAAALAAMAFAGCGQSAPERPVSLPTSDARESATSMAASLEGTLEGDAATGCVWVESDSPQEQRVAVRWPQGYSVDFSPLRLYDGAAQEVAREGQHIQVAGGFTDEGDLSACPTTRGVFFGSRPTVVPTP